MHKNIKCLFLGFFLCLGLVLMSGCETLTGTAKGLVYGVGSVGEGIQKDTINIFQILQKADKWMQKELW